MFPKILLFLIVFFSFSCSKNSNDCKEGEVYVVVMGKCIPGKKLPSKKLLNKKKNSNESNKNKDNKKLMSKKKNNNIIISNFNKKSMKTIKSKDNLIELNIESNTFKKEVKIQISNLKDIPKIDKSRVNLVGTPFNISVNQENDRFAKPITIKLKLTDKENSQIVNSDDLGIVYYNGNNWEYYDAYKLDKKNHYISFKTYHFCWFGKAKPTKKELIEKFIDKKSLEKWSSKNNNKVVKNETKKMVKQILMKKLGIENSSITQDIVESIMNENDFQKLLVSYNDNNKEQFGKDLAILAGKKIVLVIKNDSNSKTLLNGVTKHASKIETTIKMALAIKDGNFKKAAEELSNEIINSYPLTKLFREGAKIIDKQIVRWKKQGIENAFKVFANGYNRYGYKGVHKGDFEEIWRQMGGVSRQIIIDAQKRYAKTHSITPNSLTEDQRKNIIKKIKGQFKEQFRERLNKHDEINKIKEEYIKLIAEFSSAGLLEKGSKGYSEETTFDFRLERLLRITKMILNDVQTDICDKSKKHSRCISRRGIASLIKIWYRSKDEYKKKLEELGFVKSKKIVDKKLSNKKLDSNLFGKWTAKDSMGNVSGWIFKKDGSLIQISYNKRYNWHWEVKGGRIYFGYKTVKAGSHTYKIDGNKLYIYIDSIKQWGVPLFKQ